jgi:isopenicillin-N epimerase
VLPRYGPHRTALKAHFLLDPDVTYLNHGSFGACPRPVLEVYQRLQVQLEREPVDFLMRKLPGLLEDARIALGGFVGSDPDDLTFVPNATTGINMVARALDLQDGDEVLATDLEYGACIFTWRQQTRARYVQAPLETIFDHATERTRVLFVSHITSETGLLLPVEQLVARGRELGLVTVVDGAHAPAHVPLDLRALGADFYTGNCHKWLCSPKGAAFLRVAPAWQDRVGGAITSWGRESFLERTLWQGTRDYSAYLSVPAAIEFVLEHDDAERSVALAHDARDELAALTGCEPLAPVEMVRRLLCFRMPGADESMQRRLWEEHRIEIPWMRDDILRLSVAMYTERKDVERLLDVLASELRTSRSPA